VIVGKSGEISSDWNIKIPGEHNRSNVALAVKVAEISGIDKKTIRQAVEDFTGIEGRLEFLRELAGIKIYNDTTATTPDATLAGLKALSNNKNVILIIGGTDKELDMSKLVDSLDEYCKAVVLLAGTGTDKIKNQVMYKDVSTGIANNLDEALQQAITFSGTGDIILFSPAFASFGMFKNEFDRGDQFRRIVERIKI